MVFIYLRPRKEGHPAFAAVDVKGVFKLVNKFTLATPYIDANIADEVIKIHAVEIAKAGYNASVIEERLARLVQIK